MAPKIIPHSAIPSTFSLEREDINVDAPSQESTPPRRNKPDGDSSSAAPVAPDVRPNKCRPGSANNNWYMALQPAHEMDPTELWRDALMDELLAEWSPVQFDRLENWLKERSTKEMLQTLLSLRSSVSRNTRNKAIKTILQDSRIPPKCFASRQATTAWMASTLSCGYCRSDFKSRCKN